MLALVTISAATPLAVYEGPASKRAAALKAYERLGEACPRLKQASGDIIDYGLHVALPDSDGIYGEVARGMDARILVIVTLRMAARPRVIPRSVLNGPALSLVLVGSDDFSGVVVQSKGAQWLCDKPTDGPMALLPSEAIGVELAR